MFRLTSILCAAFILTACGGGSGSESSSEDQTKSFSIYSYTSSSIIESCNNGGVTLHFGFDQNGNGVLDNAEIDTNRDAIVCFGANGEDGQDGTNGSNGFDSLLKLSNEPEGLNCQHGGVKVASGPDTNRNGVLDTNEANNVQYVCNAQNGIDGQDGADGENGTNGLNSLLTLTNEPAGDNCANGGIIAKSGLDTNNNGNLDPDEVTNSQYVCNGADLTETLTVLLVSSSEPPGSNCPAGGEKFSSGIDDNNDGILQINEIDAVSYSCTVLSEYNTLTSIESAPVNICLHGGVITYVGLDTNNNGTLDISERQSQTAACAANDTPTITVPNASYLANVNVAFSQSFSINDTDGDVLSISNATKPAWLTLTVIGNNVIASGTPSESDIGQYSVSFSITDTDLSAQASFLLDTQATPDNLGSFPYENLELGEAGFSKIVAFEFADAAAFDRTVTFTIDSSSTASESTDFNLNYASQTVDAGDTETFFELEIINDSDYENIETIVINASVDGEVVDQVSFDLNDNNGYEILGSLSAPFNPEGIVIVGEVVELYGSGKTYSYDLTLEATTRATSCYGIDCMEFGFARYSHFYKGNFFRYNASSNHVTKYNSETNIFEQISPLPTNCSNEIRTRFYEKSLYILGCQAEYEQSPGTLYSFNLETSEWELKTTSGPDTASEVTFAFWSKSYSLEWENLIELNGILYLYRANKLFSFDFHTETTINETLPSNLTIFSNNPSDRISTASRIDSDLWTIPLYISPELKTKIIEFNPISKIEIVHEFNIGQNAGNGVIFHNGKWFYFGGANNLGASDRVVSFILGDN